MSTEQIKNVRVEVVGDRPVNGRYKGETLELHPEVAKQFEAAGLVAAAKEEEAPVQAEEVTPVKEEETPARKATKTSKTKPVEQPATEPTTEAAPAA
jgi:hypothetical protein